MINVLTKAGAVRDIEECGTKNTKAKTIELAAIIDERFHEVFMINFGFEKNT